MTNDNGKVTETMVTVATKVRKSGCEYFDSTLLCPNTNDAKQALNILAIFSGALKLFQNS